MNFLCFSLVGFVCACAPFGVSSTQEVDNNTKLHFLDDGIFSMLVQNSKMSLFNLKGAARVFQRMAKSLNVEIPQQDESTSFLDSFRDVVKNGLDEGLFRILGNDLCEVVSLSSQLLQVAVHLQQSVVVEDLFNRLLANLANASGQGSTQKVDRVLSQILENNQLVCRLFDGCGLQINLPDGAYSPSAYLNKLTQDMPTAETEAREPRQLLDVIQLQLDAQKELLSMLANGCGIKDPSEAQPDNQ